MHYVALSVVALTAIFLIFYIIDQHFTFFFRFGRWKFALLGKIKGFVYHDDVSVEETLRIDRAEDSVVARRLKGFQRLKKNMAELSGTTVGAKESGIVDCRFLRWKLCNPVLRALRLPYPNLALCRDGTDVRISSSDASMKYVAADAVQFFDKNFYDSLRKETNRLCEEKDPRTPITLTPEVLDHARKVRDMTRMDCVRYALSGSEAVEMAFRIARVATEKTTVVRFRASYHGHTAGTTMGGADFAYLPAMDREALKYYVEAYHYKIAAVVVNPMDFFTGPNALSPPGEKLTWGRRRRAIPTRREYARWLKCVSDTCAYVTKYLTPVAFIVDDVYFAFRTPEIHSLRYFGSAAALDDDADGADDADASKKGEEDANDFLRADLIVMGKGIGGGAPLSLVAGTKRFMNSRDKRWLLKVNKIVGTMTAWQEGVVRSSLYLDRFVALKDTRVAAFQKRCDVFTANLNAAFESHDLPVRLRNFSNVFTTDYLCPSAFTSLFPLYLMAEGKIFLSYASTGKFNLSEDWSADDLADLSERFVSSALKMKEDGFFEGSGRNVNAWLLIQRYVRSYVGVRYRQIMADKRVDIDVSHNHPVNRFVHFWSSILMICFCWPLVFVYGEIVRAAVWLLISQIVRQIGHFFYERQDRDIEKLKFGHKDKSKKIAAVGVFVSLLVYAVWRPYTFGDMLQVTMWMAFTTHAAEICHQYGFVRCLDWWIKIVTDPFTDCADFFDSAFIPPQMFKDVNWEELGRVGSVLCAGRVPVGVEKTKRA